MSLLRETKKERARLKHEIAQNNRQLKALENILNEYEVKLHPSSTTLYKHIIECMKDNTGNADFNEILEYLVDKGIEVQKQKLSTALTKSPLLHYNKKLGKWELTEDKNTHLVHHELSQKAS